MVFNFKKLSLAFISISFICSISFANDGGHGDEHGGGGHDAPKADEHGGGGHGDAGKSKVELPEWVEMQSRLMGLETQMSQKREAIRRLIEEKEHLKSNSPEVKPVVDEMVATHKELQKLMGDYEKESTVFKYRFPERGAKEGRTYHPIEIKTLQEMEHELGMEGRLTRNLKKIRSQYKPGKPEPVPETTSTKKSSNPAEGVQDPNKSSGDSVIILEK